MRVVIAVLVLGLFALFGGSAYAADLYPNHRYSRVEHGGGRSASYDQRLRVVEQVPYCGDCDNLIGRSSSPAVRLRYIGYLPWTRGCALGGCYGNYGDYGGCYWREVPVANGRGGRVRDVEKICG